MDSAPKLKRALSGAELRERAWSYSGPELSHNNVVSSFSSSPQNGIAYGASSPLLSPATQSTMKGLRSRSLSETGRKLLVGAFMDKEADPIALKTSAAEPVQTRGRRPQQKVAPSESNRHVNMYAHLLGSSDDEDHSEEAFKALVRRSSNISSMNSRKNSAFGTLKIEESVVGEDDNMANEWETVKVKKRDPLKKPAKLKPRSPSPIVSRPYSYSSDFDDLYDLQTSTFGGRQVGKAKKTMQHKAVEKRSFQTEKRARQRDRG